MSVRKEGRRGRAIERQEARAKREPQEQIKLLDDRFGEGKGAVKERARLKALIEATEQAKQTEQNKEKKGKKE
jgi:ribosomal protein S12 methylthiotransferase accessory factor YcaO